MTTPTTPWGPAGLAVAAALALGLAAGCDEYESPGAVAGEGLWSHVPADTMDENVAPFRRRERQADALESRRESLAPLLRRVEARVQEHPDPAHERELDALQRRLELFDQRLEQLRGLREQPGAFRALRQSLRADINELSADVTDLHARAGAPPGS